MRVKTFRILKMICQITTYDIKCVWLINKEL